MNRSTDLRLIINIHFTLFLLVIEYINDSDGEYLCEVLLVEAGLYELLPGHMAVPVLVTLREG